MIYHGLKRICYKAIVKNRHYIYHKYEVEHISNIFRLWHYSTLILAVDTLNKRPLSFYVTSISDAQAISKALYVLNNEFNMDLRLHQDYIFSGDTMYTREGEALKHYRAIIVKINGKKYWYVQEARKIMQAVRKFKEVYWASDDWFYNREHIKIAQYQKPKNYKQLINMAERIRLAEVL